MKKRSITLIEVLEHRPFQFWFLFVATCGILGVIFLTEHADNPFRKVGMWTKAFVASLMAFSVCLTIGPFALLFPIGLVFPAVLQGFALSLAVEEDFGRCFWWSFGGEGLVIGVVVIGACVYSMFGSVIG